MLTHEMIVKMIAHTANMWPCPADEDFDCIVNCEKCAEKLLVEYEESIRSDERKKIIAEIQSHFIPH